MQKTKLIIIAGPTASGKTSAAIEIAKRFDGEVISADSRQVYRGLDIGTAKVTEDEMDGIPHHLIDVADIEDIYTAADFKRDAEGAIADITKRGKVPIIAGGTFFYVDTLIGNVQVPEVQPNPELRAKLEKKSTLELLAELQQKDIRRFVDVDPDNRRRIIRALEIIHELDYVPPVIPQASPYEPLLIGLTVERDELRKRYQDRATDWLEKGFEKEVTDLLDQGISRERLQEIGFEYQLMLELIDRHIDKADFIEKFMQKNWQYAKRQLTWLKRYDTIKWFNPTDKKIIATITNFIGSK